jgi:uncharacterized membrane protein (UPF0127 family)
MTYPKKISDNRWIIEIKEDSKTKELYLEFPPGAIDQVGWDIGDTLEWEDLNNGSWSIRKKDAEKD